MVRPTDSSLVRSLVTLAAASALAGAVFAQVTTLDSRASTGFQGNAISDLGSLSAGGHFVAYQSLASTLAPGDNNAVTDCYLTNRTNGQTALVSRSTAGTVGNSSSWNPSVSADGRRVAFDSYATNLVGFDPNGARDVFLRDIVSGSTACVSVNPSGQPGSGYSMLYFARSLSADGQTVVFESEAADLVTGDVGGVRDVFARDLQRATTVRVSQTPAGVGGNAISSSACISAGGRWVAFVSSSSNLAPGASGTISNVYRHDLQTGANLLVSRAPSGIEWPTGSYFPSISSDGRYVVFVSACPSIVAGDTNGTEDVFVFDCSTLQTSVASRTPAGMPGNGRSTVPAISADGNYVSFESLSSNLVPGYGGWWSCFLWDRSTSTMRFMNLGPSGPSSGGAYYPSLSQSGSFVSFHSADSSLVPGDANGDHDVFTRRWRACGAIPLYADSDGDGFGGGFVVLGCPPVLGTSEMPGDCDDLDPSVHPGALERCDGVDNDCDGVVDGGLPAASFHRDADADGFGDAAVFVAACSAPSGFVANAADCDDTRADVYPGAPETCDGRDNDCDGLTDEGFIAIYCTAGTSMQGCVPSIGATGAPVGPNSASGGQFSPFTLRVAGLPGQRSALLFYGLSEVAWSWGPGSTSTLCVGYPIARLGLDQSGGTAGACDGATASDFNAFLRANPNSLGSPFGPGLTLRTQAWYRDPGAPRDTNLSNALRFTLCN